jgi:NTP pyrophosphatase (non-canonical NTP hydrolase)
VTDMTLLTETANYDEPGSWGRMSEGWPEIHGDIALAMYALAVQSKVIPYGSYVLVSERGKYGAKESCLRVHPEHIKELKLAYETGRPIMNAWKLEENPLIRRRLGKLTEEAGELLAIIGRIGVQGIDGVDPDNRVVNRQALTDELADVQAQIGCTVLALSLDQGYMAHRTAKKIRMMDEWEILLKGESHG